MMDHFMPHRPAWVEGMPLLVQNFQQWERWQDGLTEFSARRDPLHYGLLRMELLDDLHRGQLILTSCEAVLDDGTVVDIPRQDEPCSLAADLALPAADRHGSVYLVLPRSTDRLRPESRRYRREQVAAIPDDFGEAPTEPLEVLRKNLYLQICPGDKIPVGDGTVLKLAEVAREGKMLRLCPDTYIPPLLSIYASPFLIRVLEGTLRRVEERIQLLLGAVGGVVRDVTRHYDPQTLIDFWTLQALVPSARVLREMMHHAGAVHPLAAYRELLRLTAALAVLKDGNLRAADHVYDHKSLVSCFVPVCENIQRMLQDMRAEQYQWAQRVAHDGDAALWLFRFDDLAMLRDGMLFLGLQSDLPASTLERHLRQAMPMVRETDQAKQKYVIGEPGAPLGLAPYASLPKQGWVESDAVYFRIRSDNALGQDIWDSLRRTGTLSVFVPDIQMLGKLSMMLVAVRQ